MKKAIAVLAVLSIAASAGEIALDLDPIQRTDSDWLVYDNGTAQWLTWDGTYRGVWFNAEDFGTGVTYVGVQQAELWFYHHASYPWDTSDFYCEIWNGDATGPVTQLDQTLVTAIHFAPVYASYAPQLRSEPNFWCLINTEMSAGGWPSTLSDGDAPGYHSFWFDGFVWQPWGKGNYFIRIFADPNPPPSSLDNTTWGSLKATF